MRFAAVSEDEKSTCVEAGCPLRLQCELSDPSGSVRWYKDGQELLLPAMGLDAQAEGALRWLAVQSAEVCHAGQYSCQTPDDSVHFTVEIKGDLWLFKTLVHTTSNLCALFFGKPDATNTLAAFCVVFCLIVLLLIFMALDVCISMCGHFKKTKKNINRYLLCTT